MGTAFWVAAVCLGLPVFTYLGYPVSLFLVTCCVQTARDVSYLLGRRDRRRRGGTTPSVSIIIAAHNEEEVIEQTLVGCLRVNYPREKLEVLVGSDGSTDRTVEIVRRYEYSLLRVLDFPQRRGKSAVLRDCVAEATGEVLVFTDANTRLHRESLRQLVRHFQDPRVGAVCGELRLSDPEEGPAGEGVYWRYEVVLKTMENRLNAVLGANGAIYAVRRELFPPLKRNVITDDFVIPMLVRAGGARVVYDPEAVALESAPFGIADEFRRRLRIGAGNWQALLQCGRLLLPWKGFVAFAFFSHKVLRWFTPFLLAAGLAANLFLLHRPLWRWVLGAQLAFYVMAGLGYAFRYLRIPTGPLRLASYFVAINAALAIGLLRGAFGRQGPVWRRTARK